MILTHITNFLLTQMIWSITGGSYHLFFNAFLLFLLLKLWDHIKLFKALALSLFLTVGSFLLFFGITWGLLVWGLNIPYILPEDTYQGSYNSLNASLLMGALYTGIQTGMIWLMHRWLRLKAWRIFLCIFFANLISALLVYKLTFGY